MKAQRGGQRRSEVAFLHCVSELCVTQMSAGRHRRLIPLAPKSDGAQELWEPVQRDLVKGVR